MAAPPARNLSEVDAVSQMLVAVGFMPVSSVQSGNALSARHELRTQWRKLLSEGLWFNKRRDFELFPQADDTIDVPGNVMDLDENETEAESDNFIIVSGKLFKKDDNTNTFAGVTSVKLRVILALDFEACDCAVAVDYCVALATARFARGKISDRRVLDTFREDVGIARAELMRHHLNNSDLSLFGNSALAMQRRHPRVGLHGR